MDYQGILDEIYHEVQPLIGRGKVPNYIQPLALVPARQFGMALQTIDGEVCSVGDAERKFSIQSISKLFTLTIALQYAGASIWNRVGREPSGTPFNSLVQLEYEKGVPRNPFINPGALVIADIILASTGMAQQDYLSFISSLSGADALTFDETIQQAEKMTGHRNRAMANLLKDFGNLDHSVDEVLDFYFFQCAVMMNCRELAASCLYLANQGVSPLAGKIISRRKTIRINAVMLTCGNYDASGDFAFRVGLPGKSGVGGGIVAVVPDKMSLCVWSPALNSAGNSYAGTKALELFTTKTRLSIF